MAASQLEPLNEFLESYPDGLEAEYAQLLH
jgi:hypothetical protein